MKTTRKLIAMLLAVLMCFSLAACGNETAGTKDSVVIAIGSEPETLDPTQGWGHGNAPIVQSTLVRYTSHLSFENDLATGYELSPDGLTWTFSIRDDVKFTDGEKLTASDVAFTLETAKAAQGAVDLTYMESAVAQIYFLTASLLSGLVQTLLPQPQRSWQNQIPHQPDDLLNLIST